MATKISKVNAERLKKLGIEAKTEEAAKEILLKRLEDAGIPGMDDETIDNLIDIVGSFAELESEEAAAPEVGVIPAEQQADELADEAAEEEAEAEPEPEEEPEPEAESEEEAPAPAPKKKAAAPKAAPKEPKEPKPAKGAKEIKPAKAKKPRNSERGTRLKPQTVPEHMDLLRKALVKFFPEKEFQYVAVSQGISIKYGGANSKPVAIMFENVYSKDGNFATTNVVLNTFRSQAAQDKLADDGVDFEMTWNALPWLKGITWEHAMEIVQTYLPDIKAAVSTTDSRLGKNREKMEADLKATGKKAAAPAPKKAPAAKKEAPAPKAEEPKADPKAAARAALAKAAAAKKAKAAKK